MTARQRLVEVLTEDAFETPIQMIAVNSLDDAEMLDFRGSPTIRIDGIDIHLAPPDDIGLTLRAYPTDDDASAASQAVPSRISFDRPWNARAAGATDAPATPDSADTSPAR